MTTIDKIRAEIKSLQDIFVKTAEELETEDEATVYSTCAVEFGDELLSFLDTLPDEPVTDCHDFKEAAEKSWVDYEYRQGPHNHFTGGRRMTDAEIIAERFGSPCNYSPIDEEMHVHYNCEDFCGSDEQTDAKCWQRYFDMKRKDGEQ